MNGPNGKSALLRATATSPFGMSGVLKLCPGLRRKTGRSEVTCQHTELNGTAFTGNPAHSRTRGDQANKHRVPADSLGNQYIRQINGHPGKSILCVEFIFCLKSIKTESWFAPWTSSCPQTECYRPSDLQTAFSRRHPSFTHGAVAVVKPQQS